MKSFLDAILNSVLDMSAPTILGWVFLALLLSSPIAGLYAALRGGRRNLAMPLMGLALVANLVGMVVASGHARSLSDANARAVRTFAPRPPPPPPDGSSPPPGGGPEFGRFEVPQSRSLGSRILAEADADHDSLLSPDEAAAAAAAFVRSAAVEGKESIDLATLRELLRLSLRKAGDDGGRAAGEDDAASRKAPPK
jgi:hypothetical protein